MLASGLSLMRLWKRAMEMQGSERGKLGSSSSMEEHVEALLLQQQAQAMQQ
jgi:hypothetical protein